MIRVVYLASLRERAGRSAEEIDPPAGAADTVAALLGWLRRRGGPVAEALASARAVRCAVNHRVARDADPVRPGDEVAFFPPVTGG